MLRVWDSLCAEVGAQPPQAREECGRASGQRKEGTGMRVSGYLQFPVRMRPPSYVLALLFLYTVKSVLSLGPSQLPEASLRAGTMFAHL